MQLIRGFLPICSLLSLLGVAGHAEDQTPAAPDQGIVYPDKVGAYGFESDGGVFTALHDGYPGATSKEYKRVHTLSRNVTILLVAKSPAALAAETGSSAILDWVSLGEHPMIEVPSEIKPVENHPEMAMIVPKQPLEPGLYSAKVPKETGGPPYDYQFGVETPDEEPFWTRVLETRPRSWQAHNHLGALLYMRGDIKGAHAHFQKAVDLKPDNPEGHNNLGLALCMEGQFEAAIEQYEAAVKLVDSSAMLTNLANAYVQAKRYDDAIKAYRRAIDLDSQNASAYCNLGWALMQQGKVNDAIPMFRKANELDPKLSRAKDDLDRALLMKGQGH